VERPETAEVELHCHSQGREHKERGIRTRFSKRYEEALAKIAAGLGKKTGTRKTPKVLERLGRLKERYRRVAHHYEVHDPRPMRAGRRSRRSIGSARLAPTRPSGSIACAPR
jgi:hypothetical protein